MKALVLFDIDNTLLYTGGAGGAAMTLAFAELYGVADAFAGAEFHGRTDRAILATALQTHGLGEIDDDRLAQFEQAYLRHLDLTLNERRERGHLKPGIPTVLDALLTEGIQLGLATGNLRAGAERKLRYYEIARYFPGGGFGDVWLDRAAMVQDALDAFGVAAGPGPVYVVGDTPADVTSAKANGVFAIGVATGSYTVDELTEAGADLALADLGDAPDVIAQLLALGRVASA
jgi:phosphoglycolate phosphatase-like HAD superfamily hydrolase